jgi:hypothetical protein
MQPTLLILAAGIGSRYGGLKQVDGMGPNGEAILEYSVRDAKKAGFGKVVFVIRRDIEAEFRERVGNRVEAIMDTRYAYQEMSTALDWIDPKPHREKPWGTGHAILSAREHLTEPFVAINADDYYGAEAFETIAGFLMTDCTPDTYAMVAYRIANTLSENGAVSRGVCSVNPEGYLTDVVERHKIERLEPNGAISYPDEADQRVLLPDATPVSMNFWGFHQQLLPTIDELFRTFVRANLDQPRAEFYIPSVVNHQINTGAARVRVLTCESQWYGVTYPDDKATVQAALAKIG